MIIVLFYKFRISQIKKTKIVLKPKQLTFYTVFGQRILS